MHDKKVRVRREYLRSPCEFGGLSGVEANAVRYGHTTVVLGDGRLRLYYMDDGRLHEKTWPRNSWVAV